MVECLNSSIRAHAVVLTMCVVDEREDATGCKGFKFRG